MYYTNCAGARARTVTRTPQNVRTVRCTDRTPKSGVRLFTMHSTLHISTLEKKVLITALDSRNFRINLTETAKNTY